MSDWRETLLDMREHFIPDRQRDAIDAALAEIDQLHTALEVAVETIRTWHGMGMCLGEQRAWALYQSSPEMTQINAALRDDPATEISVNNT